ncbi:MAG: TonB-dependent receptor [Burkholderiales bacterium]|jgi:iron complex outermembrane receptor protein
MQKSQPKKYFQNLISLNVMSALTFCGVIVGFSPSPALSQMLEEVLVTAQKREQSIQDVGVSVTAFTGDQLTSLGFTNSIDIIAQTPGLEVSGAGGGSINSFTIRGVTQNDFAASQEGPVAVYVDDAYISTNVVTGFSLFDLARVEVLRGPQGTLFGRNATGGLIHYISQGPTQESEGFIDVELGEDARRRVEVAVSGPLSDTVAGRLSGVYNKRDGLIENDIGPDMMSRDDFSIRGQLLFNPSDDLSVLLKAQYSDEDSIRGGYAHTLSYNGAYVTDPSATDFFGYRSEGGTWNQSNDFAGVFQAEATNLSLTVNWDTGTATFTSITNYQDIDHVYGEDADASPYDIYNYMGTTDVKQFSQEFRLSWDGERSRSVVGLFYLNIDGEYGTEQSGDAYFGTGVGYPAGTSEVVLADQETVTYAIFGQTEIDLSDALMLTLGLRYNYDDKEYEFSSSDIYYIQGGNFDYADSFSDGDWSGKVQLDYRPSEDWLIYAGINRGIKSGGYNLPLFPIAANDFKFDGETLTSFEVGVKGNLTPTTRLNASVYRYDYEDYQAYSFDGFATFLFNAEAEMTGAEIELVSSPVDGLDILIGASFLDAEVTNVPLSISAAGKEDAVLAPDLSFNALIRYRWETSMGAVAIQLDGNWKDDHKFNLSYTPVIEEKAYGVANASISLTSADERWSARLFVRNLTDEEYRSYAFDSSGYFGSIEDVPGLERWVGGSVRYKW